MEKTTKNVLLTSGVIIAIISGGASILKELLHERGESQHQTEAKNDLQDSYKLTAESLNQVKYELGRLEGRIDELDHRRMQDLKNGKHVLALGEMEVQGHVGAGAGAPTAAQAAAAAAQGAQPATAPAVEAIPTNLEDGLKKERTKSKESSGE